MSEAEDTRQGGEGGGGAHAAPAGTGQAGGGGAAAAGGGGGVDASLTALVQRAAAGDAAVAELAAVKAERDAAAAERDALLVSAAEAVGKYRETRAAALPEAARTLVAGDTIAAIDASVTSASELVAKIAAEAGAQQGRRVPVGGGDRQPASTEGMSAFEMIRAGVVAAGSR